MRSLVPPLLIIAATLSTSCGSGGDAPPPAPPAVTYDPDVPAWRGGCFFEGPPGKIINATPSPDVRMYGAPCAGGSGGLAYLDAHDPVSGVGDVTVLGSAAGSRPVVVGRRGGAGAIVPGDTGIRLDPGDRRLLTLNDVSFVTGKLVLVDLASPAAPRELGNGVRVLNYDFTADGSVLFVGNYDASARTGDLFLWSDGTSERIAAGVSRAEFQMYRLDPTRTKAAYLRSWTALGGGSLLVQGVAPRGDPAPLAEGVERMEWSASGALVYAVRGADGSEVWIRDAGAAAPPRLLATAVGSWTVAGDTVVMVSGWSVLSPYGALIRAGTAPGTAESLGSFVAPEFGVALRGSVASLAWVEVSDADRHSGALRLAAGGGVPAPVDDRVAPRAGFWFSPSASFVAYAKGWRNPFASGSASPQPGIAEAVRIARVAGGPPLTIAANGSMQWITWDPFERWVGALADLDAAANAGRLEIWPTSGTADRPVFSAERVSSFWFDFGVDGQALAAIRKWDDALQRGELVVQSPDSWSAPPVVVSRDVTSYLPPRGPRVVYVVRGGNRDGLWLH